MVLRNHHRKRRKSHYRTKWFIKLVRCPYFTYNFCSWSILLTWAEDGSGEHTAARQPIARKENDLQMNEEAAGITQAEHSSITKKPLPGFLKSIKEWSSGQSDIPHIKYLSVCICVIDMHICI